MSTIKVDTIATRTGSGNITLSNNVASLTSAGAISGTNLSASGTLAVTGNTTMGGTAAITGNTTVGGTLVNTGLITASAGVAVGGTGSANTLDDYEEGSFTPTYKNEGDNNLSPTYNSTYTHARYVKIGTLVQFQFTINLTNISGGSSGQHLILNNLPFTAKSYTTNSNGGVNVTYQSSIGTAMTFGMVLGSSTSIRFYSAVNTPSLSNTLQNTTWIQGYGQYETAS